MPDAIFEDPRLVAVYDAFDGTRADLPHYLAIVEELKAKSVIDIGCGTGNFASLLAGHGVKVTGVEPAKASLDNARHKPYADRVNWVSGDATTLPSLDADLAIMTGNVAQVFLTNDSWLATLSGIHRALRANGKLVFEVRDPARKAWLEWNRPQTHTRLNVPGIGAVESWCDVTSVADELISFRWTYVFEADGTVLHSDLTLRFREREEIGQSLEQAGYRVDEVRGAPDRPGREFVFIATAI